MDAVEFIKTVNRVCHIYKHCYECPYDCMNNGACPVCWLAKNYVNADKIVGIAEQWAKDHPVKTRQSEFLKMFPNADIDCILPCDIDKTLFKAHCHDDDCGCTYCKTQYWNEEVTDND